MFALKATRLANQAQQLKPLSRGIVSGPPMVKISKAEKLGHCVAIFTGILAIPAWVLLNVRHYRGDLW